ncbi:MAG: beta-lactamase family protein [Saprospiraceae bacterium]|nr:beta-lactamase family protein [Saprospiraceae bacterium]
MTLISAKRSHQRYIRSMFWRSFIFIIVLFFLSNCHTQTAIPDAYQPPELLADGLDVGSLEEVGMDAATISKALTKIKRGKFNETHAVLIYKDDRLVLEEYFTGHRHQWDAPRHWAGLIDWDHDEFHHIMSVTKSITSTCVGIAIKEGYIESVDQSIFDYLPDHQHLSTALNENITIEHLLTMTSGWAWYEWGAPYSSAENPIIGIWISDKDPLSFILEGEIVHTPGTRFSYYGGHQILLGEILRHASGLPIDRFSQKYLFDPLGIDSVDWATRFDNGVIESAGGLRMKPRDMLKVGVTFLNDGQWSNRSIVSPDWVKHSAAPFANNREIKIPGQDSGKHNGYSYSWWIHPFKHNGATITAFLAGGWGGQQIVVIPALESVIVLTGGAYMNRVKEYRLIEKYLLAAMTST